MKLATKLAIAAVLILVLLPAALAAQATTGN